MAAMYNERKSGVSIGHCTLWGRCPPKSSETGKRKLRLLKPHRIKTLLKNRKTPVTLVNNTENDQLLKSLETLDVTIL